MRDAGLREIYRDHPLLRHMRGARFFGACARCRRNGLHGRTAWFGSACPPLVCVEGMPSVAALELLAALRDGGARLTYDGDFGGAA